MKILLHCCCAPCAIYPVKVLKEKGYEVILYWDNFNIHPLMEYIRRLDTIIQYSKDEDLKLEAHISYELEKFIKATCENTTYKVRCVPCYKERLKNTILKAKELNINIFTSTLFVSPYQDYTLMQKIAKELAKEYDIKFLDIDFREGFRWAHNVARERGYYMQPYCGCIYSEAERYNKKLKKYSK